MIPTVGSPLPLISGWRAQKNNIIVNSRFLSFLFDLLNHLFQGQ